MGGMTIDGGAVGKIRTGRESKVLLNRGCLSLFDIYLYHFLVVGNLELNAACWYFQTFRLPVAFNHHCFSLSLPWKIKSSLYLY
jgi:hypothetical protein